MNALIRTVLPTPVRDRLKRLWHGKRYLPPHGLIRWGDLRRVTPIARDFGNYRGEAIDRYYIRQFLQANHSDIRGRVLEIGDRTYTEEFGGDHVTQSDVLHAVAGNPVATLIGDLQTGDGIPREAFDCIVLLQTLHMIYDFKAALKNAIDALKPGGVLLATFPMISQISQYDMQQPWGDLWRFTPLALKRWFGEVLPMENFRITEYGNVLAAVSFLYGIGSGELKEEELSSFDPEFAMLMGVRAVRPRK